MRNDEDLTDPLVDEQEAAAAAEASEVGGPDPDPNADPATRPLSEGGEGESEGFELAEEQLERNASHEDRGGNPARDAFHRRPSPTGRSADYGEADEAGAAGEDAQASPD